MSLAEIMKLSVSERILLVEAIWDSVANETKETGYQLSKEQIHFLDEELAAYGKNKGEGSSWEDIKKRMLNK